MKQATHQLKQFTINIGQLRKVDSKPKDGYSVIIARAMLLFLLTFNLFLNAYVLMSLDRNNLLIGILTIVTCAVGQFSAITGQFGWSVGSTLLKLFLLLDLFLITISVLLDQFEQNFMTEISFVLTLVGCITGIFILSKKNEQTFG